MSLSDRHDTLPGERARPVNIGPLSSTDATETRAPNWRQQPIGVDADGHQIERWPTDQPNAERAA